MKGTQEPKPSSYLSVCPLWRLPPPCIHSQFQVSKPGGKTVCILGEYGGTILIMLPLEG